MSSTLCQGLAKEIGTFHSPVRPLLLLPRVSLVTPPLQKSHTPVVCVSHPPPPSLGFNHNTQKENRPQSAKKRGKAWDVVMKKVCCVVWYACILCLVPISFPFLSENASRPSPPPKIYPRSEHTHKLPLACEARVESKRKKRGDENMRWRYRFVGIKSRFRFRFRSSIRSRLHH